MYVIDKHIIFIIEKLNPFNKHSVSILNTMLRKVNNLYFIYKHAQYKHLNAWTFLSMQQIVNA